MENELTRRERDRAVRRVLIIELVLNLLVSAAKGVYGLASGSMSITADAIHSSADAGANIVGLIFVHKSNKPPNPRYPYGYRKLEVMASGALGASIAVVGIGFGIRALESLWTGSQAPMPDLTGLAVILSTLAVNVFVAAYEARKAKELKSGFLAADAAHTASDVLVTLAVLVSYVAGYFGLTWADEVGALVVVAMILRIAWGITTENLKLLLDRAHIPETRVRQVVLGVDGIETCHRVRSRGMPDEISIDLHVHADGNLSLSESHRLSHRVENALREADPRIVDVTIHMEPVGDPEDSL